MWVLTLGLVMKAFSADAEADGVPIYETYYRLSQLLWICLPNVLRV